MFPSGRGMHSSKKPRKKTYFKDMDIPPTVKNIPEIGWVFETDFSDNMAKRTPDKTLAKKAAKAAQTSPSGFVMARMAAFNPIIEEIYVSDLVKVNKGDTKEVVLDKIKKEWQHTS